MLTLEESGEGSNEESSEESNDISVEEMGVDIVSTEQKEAEETGNSVDVVPIISVCLLATITGIFTVKRKKEKQFDF